MRICTYNIHGGTDSQRRPSLPRIAETLAAVRADICLLQEVDRFLPRSRFQDQSAYLAERLGMECRFYGRLRVGRAAFGNAVLLRTAPAETLRVALPGGGEPRGALGVRLHEGITLWNTHLGLRPEWRVAQLATLAEAVGTTERALVGGDFNATLDERHIGDFAARAGLIVVSPDAPTFPADDPRHRIDLLLARGANPMDGGTIADPGSDHCLVWADVAW